jgi:hypothetical protein
LRTWTARTSDSRAGADSSGVTLLETLVALAITALVLSALSAAMSRAAAARERATRAASRTAAARALLLRIGAELDGALDAREPGGADRFVVAAPTDPGPPWSTLRVASMVGDEARILSYRVEPENAGRGVLVRRTASRFAPPDTREPAGVAALAGVKLFRVRCFDGTAWRPSWTAPGLPRAVEVTLGVDDGANGTEELATTVTLPLGS